MKVIGINGILSDGGGSTDLMLGKLRWFGFDTLDIHQPIRHAWDVRSETKVHKDAMQIVDVSSDGDVLIAHSYGCLKAAVAMQYVAYKAVYLFRPAMSRKYKFHPEWDTKITCIHSKDDWPIFFGGLLIGHDFGWAGRYGFKDSRVRNLKSHGSHSHDFKHVNLDLWADMVRREIT